jgi:hypothetical protein
MIKVILQTAACLYQRAESFVTTRPLLNSLIFFVLGVGVTVLVAWAIYKKQKRDAAESDAKIEKVIAGNNEALTQTIITRLRAEGVITTPKVETAVKQSVADFFSPYLGWGQASEIPATGVTSTRKAKKEPSIGEMLDYNQRHYAREEAERIKKELKAEIEKEKKDAGGS